MAFGARRDAWHLNEAEADSWGAHASDAVSVLMWFPPSVPGGDPGLAASCEQRPCCGGAALHQQGDGGGAHQISAGNPAALLRHADVCKPLRVER